MGIIGLIFWLICMAFMLVLYFLPSMIAYKKKKDFTAILVLNIFTGWTFVGWVISLVWACTSDK